jgi:hypothetical protein
MRYFVLVLVLCLLAASPAGAAELFGNFLYWKTTEGVDWALNTNNVTTNQFVSYETVDYSFAPGFQVGVAAGTEWDTKLYFTHHQARTDDSVVGNVTSAFLGGKLDQSSPVSFYFDMGEIDARIDYNMFDWNIGQTFCPSERLQVRPLVGLQGGWIDQTFRAEFQGTFTDMGTTVQRTVVETITNDFWGLGPKLGIENRLSFVSGGKLEVAVTANLYAAYLAGHWTIRDEAIRRDVPAGGSPSDSNIAVEVPSHHFGSVAFQALIGCSCRYGALSATVGYEFNDYLNQGQIFTDASGGQNNDLILQGLTVNVTCQY